MKFLCLGDIHWRASAPRARTDDYGAAMIAKMDQSLAIAEQHDAHVILPGDVFDSPTPPMGLLTAVIGQHMARNSPRKVFVVLGQHDQRYHHTDRQNTPLGVMEAAGMVKVLGSKPTPLGWEEKSTGYWAVELFGCSWNEPIPKPKENGAINILVMHRMVIGSKKLWEAQTDFMWSRHVLRRHKFDLIVTGDNHHFFTDQVPGANGLRYLVNCGSLMRANVDQVDHKPAVVLYDTKAKAIEVIPLKVPPASKVLSADVAARAKERNAELEAFVDQIGDTAMAPELNFLANLDKLARAEGVPKNVTEKVQEIVSMGDNNG